MYTVVIDEAAELAFYDDIAAHMLDARAAVAGLAMSCRMALSQSSADRRPGRAACHIYEHLVGIPGIFEMPKPVSNADLSKDPVLCLSPILLDHSLRQLEACELIEREGEGDLQTIRLLAPDWVREFHEQRLKRQWELDERDGPHLTFERGYAFWTTFGHRCILAGSQ